MTLRLDSSDLRHHKGKLIGMSWWWYGNLMLGYGSDRQLYMIRPKGGRGIRVFEPYTYGRNRAFNLGDLWELPERLNQYAIRVNK